MFELNCKITLADFPQALAIVIINKLSTQGVPSFSGILGGFFFPHAILLFTKFTLFKENSKYRH